MLKKSYRIFFILLAYLISPSLQAAATTWTLDPEHTYVLWKIKHLDFSTQSGKWFAKGELILDKDNPKLSKVTATVNIANIVTGIPELDKHLMGEVFFNAAKFPTATFVSDKVRVLNKTTADVDGHLTLRGITKPLVLHVTFNKVAKHPINDKMAVGFTATAQLKRSDFGMDTLLPSLGDNIDLEINAEAYQTTEDAHATH